MLKSSITTITLVTAMLLIFSPTVKAVNLSLGIGYPFVLVPNISINNNDIRYYANYKLGLDDGFSLGAEMINGKHKYGAFVGAVGSRQTDRGCTDITSLCIILTDHKTTQGLGVSYEYHLSDTVNSGWAIRLEAGYGEESSLNKKRADGNIQIMYHF